MARRKPIRKRYAPSVWPTWLLIGWAWLIARLPLAWIFALGEGIGRLAYRIGGARRRIAETNIRRCFPDLSPAEQNKLVEDTFAAVTLGALEMAIPWLNPKRDLSTHFTVHGRDHLDAALAHGRGVILVGGHFAVMDAICQPLKETGSIDVMYRFNKNPAWEWLQVKGRRHFFDGVIERQDIRGTLKRLKQGRAIWYAADQDYGRKHSVFAPFFGIATATIVATSRFARLNNSPVLMMAQVRDRQNMHWHIHFSPVLEGFPSGDDAADAARLNALLEDQIRQNPAQYLWMHKRFKTRPEGDPPFYDR
ncbi:MAG: LpxL/LpxP family Kdo(2)-lipid IV(A) lauroyl/palmitoleoyl acyltransferase [bacterium]